MGRVGGEEFALLYYKSTRKEVKEEIESIRSEVEQLETFTQDGTLVQCTISEGIATATPQTKRLDALLQIADKSLYIAKGSGRNRVIFR